MVKFKESSLRVEELKVSTVFKYPKTILTKGPKSHNIWVGMVSTQKFPSCNELLMCALQISHHPPKQGMRSCGYSTVS